MGDRCYLEVICSARTAVELELADETLFTKEEKAKVGRYEDDQVNYGLIGNRERATKKGHVFIGLHGDGSNYGGCLFASDGKIMAECGTAYGTPVVTIKLEDKGKVTVSAKEMKNAQRFVNVWNYAAKKLGVSGTAFGNWFTLGESEDADPSAERLEHG